MKIGVAVPNGGFRTIVADPPWLFSNKTSNIPVNCTHPSYPCLPDDAIANMPVSALAAESAHLYLWIVAAKAEAGYAVCRAWGFRPVMELWWLKRRPQMMLLDMLPPRGCSMGLGYYFRHAGERCLFGVRGRLRLLRKDLDSLVVEPKREHSRKPDAFYRLVERASPAPRLELFARQERGGWAAWGNETGKFGRCA